MELIPFIAYDREISSMRRDWGEIAFARLKEQYRQDRPDIPVELMLKLAVLQIFLDRNYINKYQCMDEKRRLVKPYGGRLKYMKLVEKSN